MIGQSPKVLLARTTVTALGIIDPSICYENGASRKLTLMGIMHGARLENPAQAE